MTSSRQAATACAALLTLVCSSAYAQTAAMKANDFLNSISASVHIRQGEDDPTKAVAALKYAGIRNLRDDGAISKLIDIHNATGVKFCLVATGVWNPAYMVSVAKQLAAAGALLAVEGANEPNNWSVTYNGVESSNVSFKPIAEFQRDLYAAVHADPKLAGIPVFHCSECGGAEPDNVGLQFLTIPTGADILMPDGTKYADYANAHNYVVDHLRARQGIAESVSAGQI